MTLHAAPVMVAALCVLAIGYRYYSAFIAAKALALNDANPTPAHTMGDGHNYVPTKKWVLFGHHFAAISGSGPLIGPTLAAQFGFAPGFLWILCGVVLAGATHDFVILTASIRRRGRSLAEIAREELGPVPGLVAMVAILAIVVIAISGLGIVVVGALAESAWGTFTVAASIPIALGMGFYTYKLRPGPTAVRDSTIVGIVLLLVALVAGKWVQDSAWGETLRLSRTTITLAIAAYGFTASVLPVWLLLCPRDYLSSYLKIGTIALLVVGVILVNPKIEAPMFTQWVHGGGPIVKGPLFPFVFVTIACGAISGFHSLVASGTTPKMIDKESDARPIAYGGMLMEGLVGITALIAATSLPMNDYLAINTDPPVAMLGARGEAGVARDEEDLARLGHAMTPADRAVLDHATPGCTHDLAHCTVPLSAALSLGNGALAAAGYHVDARDPTPSTLTGDDFDRLGLATNDLPRLAASTHERIAARTGGGVSLAVGMARIFAGIPGASHLGDVLAYWYHFAIMFEALFILTTIDTGTRVGRFLVQEFLGKMSPALGKTESVPAGVVATLLVVGGWTAFLLTGTVQTIWPMFGIANQLLAVIALSVGTTFILKSERRRYAWVTFLPLCFVGTTTLTAGVMAVAKIYVPLTHAAEHAKRVQGWSSALFTSGLLVCVVVILAWSFATWISVLRGQSQPVSSALEK